MRKLFAPAIAVMNRLTYSRKFFLLGLCFFIPLAFTLGLLNTEFDKQIFFAEKERMGLEYNKTLRHLVDGMQQHRGMSSAFLSGDASFKEKMLAKQSQIDEEINYIEALDKKMDQHLNTAATMTKIKTNWDKLKSDLFNLKAQESIARHTELIGEVLDLTGHVAATSNLILDPHLDANYLRSVVEDKLLFSAEKMGQLRAKGSGVAARGTITQDEKIDLIVLAGLIKSALQDVNEGMEIALKENQRLKPKLHAPIEENAKAVSTYLTILDTRIINAGVIDIPPLQYFEAATRAIDVSYKLRRRCNRS